MAEQNDSKSQARLCAENIINEFWMSQVMKAAQASLVNGGGCIMLPPTAEQYAACEKWTQALASEALTQVFLAESRKASAALDVERAKRTRK